MVSLVKPLKMARSVPMSVRLAWKHFEYRRDPPRGGSKTNRSPARSIRAGHEIVMMMLVPENIIVNLSERL